MKDLTLRFLFLTMTAAFVSTLPLYAADPIETHWNEMCRLASGKQLVLTTADGVTVNGYCLRINADEMEFGTLDYRSIKIARAALANLRLRRKGHQLAALGHGMRSGIKQELDWVLSPLAPLGLVSFPAT